MDESTRRPRTRIDVAGIPELPPPIARLAPVQWLVCGVAALGFAFDLYETLVMPLIARPALTALGNFKPGSAASNLWVGLLFYLPLASGGIFGLLGGYLADLLGVGVFWCGASCCMPSRLTPPALHLRCRSYCFSVAPPSSACVSNMWLA